MDSSAHPSTSPTSRRRLRRRRLVRTTSVVAALAALMAFSASCAPPAQPPWVGVQWVRDAGGTVNPDGSYTPSWQRYVTSNGVTSGPTPTPTLDPILLPFGSNLPDGTARYPWNGFAGEGFTTTQTPPGPGVTYTLHYPAGSCVIGFADADSRLNSVLPSPDGQRVAVVSSFSFAGVTNSTLSIRSVGATTCPTIVSASYVFTSGLNPPGFIVGSRVVWKPDSSAVVTTLETPVLNQPPGSAVIRLDASTGATPTPVLAASEGCLAASGWSVDNRLLLICAGPAAFQLRLITIPLGTPGTTNTLWSFTGTADTVGPGFPLAYYVPGTSTIVFNNPFPVVNSDGFLQAWWQVHTAFDLPFAPSTPITGSAPTLAWHPVPVNGSTVPPYTFTDMPNIETVERLAH